MISVNNISKEFRGELLFKNINFNISKKERIGLAGKNGAGKSSLLNIIAGELAPDSGSVVMSSDIKPGYLKQEMLTDTHNNVIDEALKVFSFLDEKQNRLDELTHQISIREDYESNAYLKLVDEIDTLNHELMLYDAGKLRGKAEIILKGLGFVASDFQRKLKEFSHGWRMRVELAKLLLQNPQLLLLDEPTNHLDIESIQWLEDYLKNYNGSVILVSHDRTLLDKLSTRTIEINQGRAYDYKVTYSEYIRLREERQEQLEASFSNQQRQLREIERFVERFRYKASKAKQVQSRVKQLDKVERVELDKRDTKSIHFSFPEAPASGKIAVDAKKITKYYGDKLVLQDVEIHIIRGEKVAFVGKNGEGKSTMAKIINDNIDFSGELKMGHNVVLGYYSQDIWEMLDPDLSVLETIDNIAIGDIRTKIKSILGAFLFQGDDIDKKVKILSGGEKSRLALVKLLMTPTNFLLLDEPTNHLDILSKDILKDALLQYKGTVVIVSHDRDFLMGLTNRCIEFKDKGVKEYLGDIQYFLEKKRERSSSRNIGGAEKSKSTNKTSNKISWEKKKEIEKQARKINREISLCEQQIEKLEDELSEVNLKLADPEGNAAELKSGELFKAHDNLSSKITEVYASWEVLTNRLDEKQPIDD
ncbi:MAG: ABC-F family ATP-binding cassette domain-containing protein [Chlorobi bacterium]|nr:ABC-F family ATP-binding cassette domain-containing protein [Chlorobiota bacterium]